jgi:hypothetical protein
MSELIKVARTDRIPVGAHKLCTIEDRRIAIFNLVRGQTAAESKASDLA